jgi:hypothetical protein
MFFDLKIKLNYCIFALILLFLFIFGFLIQNHFMISDQFERERIAKEIIVNEEFPEFNYNYGFPLKNIYAPLFDLLLAFLSIVSKNELFFVFKFLSLIVFILLFGFSFLLARKHFSFNLSLLAATITLMLPWIFRRTLNVIPESFGLTFFICSLYFLTEKKYKVLALILPFFALFHYRSFISFLIVFFFYSIYLIKEKKIKLKEFLMPCLSTLALTFFWFYPRINEIISIKTIENPWLSNNIFNAFSITLIFAFFGLIITLRKKEFSIYSWLLIFFSFFVLIKSNVLSLRESIYIFFPLSFFSVKFIEEIKSNLIAFIVSSILILLLCFNALTIIFEESYFTEERINAIKKLNEFNGDIVFADFIGSYVIPAKTNKKIIAGAFLEQLDDAEIRVKEQFNAFKECNISNELIKKYKINLIYLNHVWKSFGCKKLNENKFKLLWQENENLIYEVKN